MPRLSIDVTEQQHKKLKAMAALKGMSIKEFVLQQTIADTPSIDGVTEEDAMAMLKAILQMRADRALNGHNEHIPSGSLVDTLKVRFHSDDD